MNEIDYINKMVGTPWVRGKTDCYWVVEDSYKKIDGINLPEPPWRKEGDIARAGEIAINSGFYQSCECESGAIIAAYKDGVLKHVGRVLVGYVLHSDGSFIKDGEAVAVPVKKFERMYRLLGFEIKYYKVVI